jgi:Putative peptidoglycan binding domain
MILKQGREDRAVRELRSLMRKAGYQLADSKLFDSQLERCVKSYQEDRGLAIDGVVLYGHGETWPNLLAEPAVELIEDSSPRAKRLSAGLAILYDPQLGHMKPRYRSSDVTAWKRMERGEVNAFIVPYACDGSGQHGATCGHAAWLLTSWWMRALHPDKGIYPTWRTGRGPTKTMPNRMLSGCSVEGEVIRGRLCRGLKEYTAEPVIVKELAQLSAQEHSSQWYLCQRHSGHVVCVLNIGEAMGCIDPRTGIPAIPGLYRLAADGSKATKGRPWTWRRVRAGEGGRWTCYGMASIPESGEIQSGPLKGAPDLPLVLEDTLDG